MAAGDASNLLPYLVGSAPILAHKYTDKTVAFTSIHVELLLPFIGVVLAFGVIGVFFVPTLPLGLPRRDFGAVSIVTLRGEGLPWRTDPSWEDEDLDALQKKLGASKLRFGI